MKKSIILQLGLSLLLALLLVGGCSLSTPDETKDLVAPTGEATFRNYAAMGNSLTAGFQDGGVCINAQLSSFPRLIAMQLGLDASLGSSEFTQPYIAMPGIGSTASNDPTKVNGVMHFDGTGISVLGTHDVADVIDATSPKNPLLLASLPVPYDNHGVPGATIHDVMNAYDAYTSVPIGNSYFLFINRSSFLGNTHVEGVAGVSPTYETSSMFWHTIAQGPSLTTLWIGNNDILGGAMSGNPVVGENLTDAATFQLEYGTLLASLAGALVQRTGFPGTIVVANIPSISTIPFFIPKALFQSALPEEMGGDWPWGYADGNDDAGMLLTLPVLSWMELETSPGTPIPSQYTLTSAEVGVVETQVATFNGLIAAISAGVNAGGSAKIAMVDANALMTEIKAGTHEAGPHASTHFSFLLAAGMTIEQAAGTTLFSLDGIHPNSKGYGVIANAFIDKINELQGTSVAHVDWASITWDPTYGATLGGETKLAGTMPRLDPEAAHSMGAIWR